MPTRYVGPGGNDGNSGLSWALRKLTLNGVEDTPVVPGDTVYVGPGTYRETLACDVSGGAGTPITYIGDYAGANTDGVGGVVRITGSDNDQTAVRANCITGTARDYRTFQGFLFDVTTSIVVYGVNSINWTVQDSIFGQSTSNAACLYCSGAPQSNWLVQRCVFNGFSAAATLIFTHNVLTDNANHVVQNCVVLGGNIGIMFQRVGNCTVRNCHVGFARGIGINVSIALTPGQTITVNNSIIESCYTGFTAAVLGDLIEDYNDIYGCNTARSLVNVGANSLAYPPLFDARWFFEMTNGGRLVTPFDLGQWSQIINVAGLNPTATDMRGTGTIGAEREWGSLEYDDTLLIEGGAGGGLLSANKKGNKQA